MIIRQILIIKQWKDYYKINLKIDQINKNSQMDCKCIF